MATEEQVYTLIGRQFLANYDQAAEIRRLREENARLQAIVTASEACECDCKEEGNDEE